MLECKPSREQAIDNNTGMPAPDLCSRLLAILAADVVGYSRLMSLDEHATVAALDLGRAVFQEQIDAHGGRVIDMAGDSVLSVFDTATGAMSAALSVQQQLAALATDVPDDRRLRYRIGVHVGDVIEKADGTVYGDGRSRPH
jgi:adenylate cyclase